MELASRGSVDSIRLQTKGHVRSYILRQQNKRVCVTIFTDGESSDGDVTQALKLLENLPVWVVIRLCTDEENIVNYWNEVDNHLEIAMDVLDDLFG